MAQNVWHDTLKLLKETPSYQGIFHMMERFLDDTAAEIIDEHDNIIRRTYREYIRMSYCACGVMEKKRPAGDVVGLIYDTCMDWPVLLWGILMSGQLPLLLNPSARPEQLNNLMAEAHATCYVAAHPIDGSNLEFIDAAQVLRGDEPGHEHWGEYIALCTSGTTDISRIFLYDARTIAGHIISFDDAKQVNPDMPFIENKPCKLLAFLPFHHIFGFSVVYLLYACTGKVLVFCKDKSANTILATSKRCGITHLYCVPMFFNALASGIKRELGSRGLNPITKYIIKKKTLGTQIRSMITGGGHVPSETLSLLNDIGYPLCNGFGMTETGIISVETSLDPTQRKMGSIGTPFSLTEYKIGNGTSDEGELFIRGDALYSAHIIDGKIVPRDTAKWFATGDIVKRTPFGLFICGRTKDVIISASGENIYPDELEQYFSALSGVEKSCIIGIENESYEDISIISQISNDFDRDNYLKQIRKINESLPIGERVTRAFITNKRLPVSGNMKVMHYKVKENIDQYEELALSNLYKSNNSEMTDERTSYGPAEKELDEIKANVLSIIAKTLNYTDEERDAISTADSFIEDLKMNSIDLFCCIADIEDQYDIDILAEYAPNLNNIDQAAKYIYTAIHSSDTAS